MSFGAKHFSFSQKPRKAQPHQGDAFCVLLLLLIAQTTLCLAKEDYCYSCDWQIPPSPYSTSLPLCVFVADPREECELGLNFTIVPLTIEPGPTRVFRADGEEVGPFGEHRIPYLNGDYSVNTGETDVGADQYATAYIFNLFAPLYSLMMFEPWQAEDEEVWGALTRALDDCNLKQEPTDLDDFNYNTQQMRNVLLAPGEFPSFVSIRDDVLRFLEESAGSLNCVATEGRYPEDSGNCEYDNGTWADRSCWVDAYMALYPDEAEVLAERLGFEQQQEEDEQQQEDEGEEDAGMTIWILALGYAVFAIICVMIVRWRRKAEYETISQTQNAQNEIDQTF